MLRGVHATKALANGASPLIVSEANGLSLQTPSAKWVQAAGKRGSKWINRKQCVRKWPSLRGFYVQ